MGSKRAWDEAKKTPESYRRPYKQARVRLALAELAEQRAEELAQDFTQYVNDAIRMRLEAEGKWPPRPADGKK